MTEPSDTPRPGRFVNVTHRECDTRIAQLERDLAAARAELDELKTKDGVRRYYKLREEKNNLRGSYDHVRDVLIRALGIPAHELRPLEYYARLIVEKQDNIEADRDRLQAENAELKKANEQLFAHGESMFQDRDRLQAELEGLRAFSRSVNEALDKLRAALQDMVDAGMRFDLNPTYDMREPHKFFSDYIARMDEALRERAQWALDSRAKP